MQTSSIWMWRQAFRLTVSQTDKMLLAEAASVLLLQACNQGH